MGASHQLTIDWQLIGEGAERLDEVLYIHHFPLIAM
jgi:hypothetical protein